jgi:hypothetical protein
MDASASISSPDKVRPAPSATAAMARPPSIEAIHVPDTLIFGRKITDSTFLQEVVLYPAYIDSEKTWKGGRRVSKASGVAL